MKNAIVTSDVHLGSRFCDVGAFLAFLDALPGGVTLVLNGDIVDPWRKLPPPHAAALDRLKQESLKREVIWIRGNNDRRLVLKDFGQVRFEDAGLNGGSVYVAHGHEFDRLLHHNPLLTFPFRILYWTRWLRGAPPMHVGAYAKQWAWLYRMLLAHVVSRAVRCASRKGCRTIICGHTHCAEDREVGGVRYLNTGSWTEEPYHCVVIEGETVTLKPVADMLPDGKTNT